MAIIIKESKGFSVEEAKRNVELPLEVAKNATQAWKKFGMNDFDSFVETYVKKNKNAKGLFYIIKKNPIGSTRQRPYSVENFAVDGARKFTTAYQLIGANTGKMHDTVVGKKSVATKRAKELVKSEKEGIELNIIKVCTEGVSKVSIVSYSPSVNTTEGEYVFFGEVEGRLSI